jgi:hypothetical protein
MTRRSLLGTSGERWRQRQRQQHRVGQASGDFRRVHLPFTEHVHQPSPPSPPLVWVLTNYRSCEPCPPHDTSGGCCWAVLHGQHILGPIYWDTGEGRLWTWTRCGLWSVHDDRFGSGLSLFFFFSEQRTATGSRVLLCVLSLPFPRSHDTCPKAVSRLRNNTTHMDLHPALIHNDTDICAEKGKTGWGCWGLRRRGTSCHTSFVSPLSVLRRSCLLTQLESRAPPISTNL